MLTWDEDFHREIIDGKLYRIETPLRFHQDIRRELSMQMGGFIKGKPYEIYAPIGVRLFPKPDNSDDTVVLPDIAVICDRSKLDDYGCNGAPDLIVEILSPSTARHDRVLKFRKYLEAGVREYWMVYPDEKTIDVHILENGRYTTKAYEETDEVPVSVLPGCVITLKDVFAS
jgi:Uma2 family endonuclease